MGGLLVRLFTWLGGTFLAQFVSGKVFLTALLGTVFTAYLWNLGIEFLQAGLDWGTGALASVGTPGGASPVVQLSGLAGYFASVFRVPECIAFVIAVEVARFAIRIVAGLVPGLGGLRG